MIPTIATIPVYPYSFELRVYPPVKTYLIGDDEIDIFLLTSGWWAYARKPNYTADWIQSLTWGLCVGPASAIPYFYSAFFITVLVHRCGCDFERCEIKYGKDWDRYCQVVKYKFIPGIY